MDVLTYVLNEVVRFEEEEETYEAEVPDDLPEVIAHDEDRPASPTDSESSGISSASSMTTSSGSSSSTTKSSSSSSSADSSSSTSSNLSSASSASSSTLSSSSSAASTSSLSSTPSTTSSFSTSSTESQIPKADPSVAVLNWRNNIAKELPGIHEDREPLDGDVDEIVAVAPEPTKTTIMYDGRNILELRRNIQPERWQLFSPLNDRRNINVQMDHISICRFEQKLLDTCCFRTHCKHCGFVQPSEIVQKQLEPDH